MSVEELTERMRNWLGADYQAVIFSDDRGPLAYALFRETSSGIHLRQFFVGRAYRRQGIGRKAITLLRREIWPRDKRLRVEVLTENPTGVAFWRAVGFQDYSLALELSAEAPIEAATCDGREPSSAIQASFWSIFQAEPTLLVRAPGRINLIGEHIDYLGGCVMPLAVESQLTLLADAGRSTQEIEVFSDRTVGGPQILNIANLQPRKSEADQWLNYLLGVLAAYDEAGIELRGFRAHLTSDIPMGAGLSSSAALETAFALAVEHFAGVSLSPVRRAQLCQQAEHVYAGVPCGIMDQLAVGACREGQVMTLDCRDLSMRHAPLPSDIVVVIANTEVPHSHADSEYALRRQQCEDVLRRLKLESFPDLQPDDLPELESRLGDPILYRRLRHVVTEMDRVERMNQALAAGDLLAIEQIMAAGHASARE